MLLLVVVVVVYIARVAGVLLLQQFTVCKTINLLIVRFVIVG